MRFGIVVFPGTNCDQDCYHVIHSVLGEPAEYIWHQERDLNKYDCIILPGGFSYGDYLRTGAIARFSPVMEAVTAAAAAGKLVLGICNGFQVLMEAGLLPGAMRRNDSLQFRCHYTYVRVENNNTPFTRNYRQGEILRMPIAHGEGNYYCDPAALDELQRENRIVLRYCNDRGETTSASNPNGSLDNIAGICNRAGNVLGIMPHPERCAEAILGSEDGRRFFTSVVDYLKAGGRD